MQVERLSQDLLDQGDTVPSHVSTSREMDILWYSPSRARLRPLTYHHS